MPGRTLFPYTTLFRSELVDLVAEEIVTYHTEIAKRQERIEALTSEVGNRYSYSNMIGKSKPMQERSEERRVRKECRSRRSPEHEKKKRQREESARTGG